MSRRLLREVLRRRWLLAGALATLAVATALPTLAPAVAPQAVVLAAARDLPAGSALAAGDLVPLDLPAAAVPGGALVDVGQGDGRLLASAVRRGEVLTDVRLVGPGLLHGARSDGETTGGVAAPVRLADPATGSFLPAGSRVDVLAATLDTAETRVVAEGATVLAVPDVPDDGSGALVLLAVPPSVAARLAAAALTARLSVVLLPP